MNKKIAILIGKFGILGGLEKYARHLADAFHKKGCDISLLTSGKTDHIECSFQIISFGSLSKTHFLRLKQFDLKCLEWMKKNPVDIVFGMDRNSAQTHYRAGNGVHAAYLQRRSKYSSFWKNLSFKINPLHRTILNFEKQTYESPQIQRIFTNSQMVKEEILHYYKCDPQKISVVHNGVQWKQLQQPFEDWPYRKNQILQQLNLPKDRFHLLFIGNEYRRKGLEYLLKALSIAKNPMIHLSVVGKERNLKEFQKKAHQLNLSSNISFFGSQTDVTPFYQLADCVVIPSIYDPFANVTVEALAMGCFVISSNQNGGSEILTSQNGRVLKDLEDAEAFADILNQRFKYPKSFEDSAQIRNSVKHLDFENQLGTIVEKTLYIIPIRKNV